MDILKLNKSLLKLAGLSTGTGSSRAKWLRWFWLASISTIVIPCVNYVAEHIDDLADTTDVYYVLMSIFQTLVKYGVFWFHLNEITQLLDKVQARCDEREYAKR